MATVKVTFSTTLETLIQKIIKQKSRITQIVKNLIEEINKYRRALTKAKQDMKSPKRRT
jgi:hypothetical protein